MKKYKSCLDNNQKRPDKFNKKIAVIFDETLTFSVQGTLKTGDQLFSDEFVKKSPVEEWVFHVFNFQFNETKYEFKVRDDKKNYNVYKGKEYLAYLNSESEKSCWFKNKERIVYLWEPEEDDEDDLL